MRIALALALVIAAGTAAVVLVAARDEPTAAGAGAVTLVGDSLNVGLEPYLRDALAGWSVDAHDRVGRATPEGVEELRALGANLAPVVVVSLGTNDPDGSEEEFRALVADAMAIAGPRRCVLWATIVREGTPREGFNRVLRDAASEHSNLELVDWAAMVARDPGLLASDAVHGTPDGYARRAEETARASRDCTPPSAVG
jgi:hypothetical protein